jgi:transposase
MPSFSSKGYWAFWIGLPGKSGASVIEEQTRAMVRQLFEQGKAKRQIARFLNLDIKSVRDILSGPAGAPRTRKDKIHLDVDLLRQLHERCEGYAQRVQEILQDEYHIRVGYSTLTRRLQEYEIRKTTKKRDERYPDVPGEEMQQDTSVYTVTLGDKRRKVVCSGLYYRYSKMRYVTFAFRFDRFRLKCFFHEALGFYGYTAKVCIVDNTNLVVYYGSGEKAVFHPETLAFAKQYGFCWKAHRIRHPNRKAGKERDFLTLQTNFFPGRRFSDLEDLNRQAFHWATERFATRPLSKTRLIPRVLFEEEKPFLLRLPSYLQPPYQQHQRIVDDYGYAALDANYYWVPEGVRGTVCLIEYAKSLAIYQANRKLIDYPLPTAEVKNKEFSPPDRPVPSRGPHNRRYGCAEEQQKLRRLGEICTRYLDYLDSPRCPAHGKAKLVRDLYRLSRKLEPQLFLKTIERALHYQITSLNSLERIASQLLCQDLPTLPPPLAAQDYETRSSYQAGRFSAEADLSAYQRLLEDEQDER